jgi:hypothetical protein
MKTAAIAVLVLATAASLRGQDDAWNEIKAKHFLVYYVGEREFAERVARSAEEDYSKIAQDLGFTRHDNFWLWDRRAKIYIYRARADFTRATGAPKWAAGKADYQARLIATYEGSETFIDSVLPHELTHLIFMEFVGFTADIPLWLNEGVAQWEDALARDRALRLVRGLHADKRLTPLTRLMTVTVGDVGSTGQAVAFYAQAVSLVGFMIEKHGSAQFRVFCGELRDGKSVEDALRFTYPGTIRSMESLETEWHQHLEASE